MNHPGIMSFLSEIFLQVGHQFELQCIDVFVSRIIKSLATHLRGINRSQGHYCQHVYLWVVLCSPRDVLLNHVVVIFQGLIIVSHNQN